MNICAYCNNKVKENEKCPYCGAPSSPCKKTPVPPPPVFPPNQIIEEGGGLWLMPIAVILALVSALMFLKGVIEFISR